MTRKTIFVGVALLLAAIAAGIGILAGRFGKRPSQEARLTNSTSGAASTSRTLFVELVLLQSFASIGEDRQMGTLPRAGIPDGYLLDARRRLFPSRGQVAETLQARLALGLQLRLPRQLRGGIHLDLEVHSIGPRSVDLDRLPPAQTVAGLGPLASLRAVPRITDLEIGGDDALRLVVDGEARRILPGKEMVLGRLSRHFTAERVLETWKRHAVVPGTLESVKSWLREQFGSDSVTVHGMLVGIHRGKVQYRPFDLAHSWRRARALAHAGDSTQARPLLDRLREALPGHRGIRRALESLEARAVPGQLTGRVVLPALSGARKERHARLVAALGAGWVGAARKDRPEDQVSHTARLEGGTFQLHLPRGRYRVMVAVPGFRKMRTEVEVGARTRIDLVLEQRLWRGD